LAPPDPPVCPGSRDLRERQEPLEQRVPQASREVVERTDAQVLSGRLDVLDHLVVLVLLERRDRWEMLVSLDPPASKALSVHPD